MKRSPLPVSRIYLDRHFEKAPFEETVVGLQHKQLVSEFRRGVEDAIEKAIIAAGFDPGDSEFMKQHIQIIIKQNDYYTHHYYHYGMPDEKRIISIQTEPTFAENITENFGVKHTLSVNYY